MEVNFLTVLALLESLCASSAGASRWHSLIYLGSMQNLCLAIKLTPS